MRQVLTGCVLLLTAGAAAAQLMECIDAKGAKTFAHYCPPDTVKENRLMKSGAGPGPAAHYVDDQPALPAQPAEYALMPWLRRRLQMASLAAARVAQAVYALQKAVGD